MPLPIATLLQGGKYRILRFISSGGFGCTYEAEHVMLQSRVAIKEFFVKDFCNRDEHTAQVSVGTTSKQELVAKLRRKFIDEARGLVSLHHNGVVRVQDVFEENGTAYFVMDFIQGESLSRRIKTRGALPEAVALNYIRQVAEALAYVHGKSRLHLDIKPGNIMVDESGRAVLIDFGASKQYDEENGENTSTLVGRTPGFAPPEQMSNNVVKFSPATDIYALGATFYALLTGETPPDANLINSGDATLKPLPATIGENTRNAVIAAMQSRRPDRPQTIADFLAILNGAADDSDETVLVRNEPAKKQESEPNKPVRPEKTNRPVRLKWPFVVAVVVVLTVLMGYLVANGFYSNVRSAEDTITDTCVVDFAAANTVVMEVTDQVIKLNDGYGTTFKYTGPVDTNGRANGEGTGVYKEGIYEGEYLNDLRHGEGAYRLNDGSNSFIGTFKNDYYDRGSMTLSDGTYFSGSFREGQPYNGSWYNAQHDLISTVKNGE